MKLGEGCWQCLYDIEAKLTQDESYLADVRAILNSWKSDESAPYIEYKLNKLYAQYFGRSFRFAEVKKQFNDLMLSMVPDIRSRIEKAEDPLKVSLFMARIGNYIDFGAVKNVEAEELMKILTEPSISECDEKTYRSFLQRCEGAKSFLLLADNCGEIVLDMLFLEQLKRRFPQLKITVMVRGSEVLNDVTYEDAEYIGLTGLYDVVSNGEPLAGTVYSMLPPEAKAAFDCADVILSKGQGNYESAAGSGRRIFYSFLCKCNVFTEYFKVPRLTGMFIEEAASSEQ